VSVLAGLVIFALVYALLAIPGLAARAERWIRWAPARRVLTRPGLAIAGALLVVLVGAVAPRAAWDAIDGPTLALLLGMMLLVAALDAARFFELLATRLVQVLPTPRRLLAGSMIVVAILSALVLNDAVVLLFTPVLVRATRAMQVSAFPFLAAEAFAANLGSSATPIGNPQNAFIASARHLSFLDFARALAPVATLCLLVGIAMCLFAFRKELPPRASQPPAEAPVRANRAMLAISLGAVTLALAGFLVGPLLGIELWMVALGAGLLALAAAPVARVAPGRLLRSVDAGILVFFVGLFVLLQVVKDAGALDLLGGLLDRAGSWGFVVATALLSNVVSNVPAVILLLPLVPSDAKALLLAMTSTLAGNLTFLGSAATVIVAETARSRGEPFDVGRFTLIGLGIGTVTLVIAWLILG
jgi:Na+/H+ antiporter NhaD/arsenite permease-like protein